MSNLTDFFPSGGGGGLTPKFQEFTSSGTFTPSQALIDAGGYIEVFLVAGGGRSYTGAYGGSGGEVLIKKMYLTNTSGIVVTVAGASTSTGGNSSFAGSSAGGVDVTALGGSQSSGMQLSLSPSWGGGGDDNLVPSAGNGVFGYGAGGAAKVYATYGGVNNPKPNSGQGGSNNVNGGSGYCLIKWYE